MKITVKVTKEILEASKMCGHEIGKEAPKNCAVALSVREIMPDAEVGHSYINLEYCQIKLPLFARQFIKCFDSISIEKRPLMHELSFEIDVPDSVIESIGIDEVEQILSNSKTLEYVG